MAAYKSGEVVGIIGHKGAGKGPIFAMHDAVFARVHIGHEYLKYFSGITAVLVATVAFFWLFEKPFLSSSQKQEVSAAPLVPTRLAVGANV
jgi:hypothetical protein